MIVKNYDIGWGPEWPMKQFEQQILEPVISAYRTDTSKTVVINSVWYHQTYHQQVMQELRELSPTRIVVVALLDPPIVQLEWFCELECEVIGVGYYPGSDIDYFALFMDKYYQTTESDLLNSTTIDTAYMCLNRKPHPHRLRLYQGLESAGILDSGIVSLGGNPPIRLIDDNVNRQDLAPNGGTEQYGIVNDIVSLGNLNNWRRHLLNIVTETIWDIEPSNFISEKTFKPILGLRPFLLYAPNGGVNCLTARGFEPYVSDFLDIFDGDLTQPYNIPNFLKVLCNQEPDYWKMKFAKLKEKLLHNQQRFKDYASSQRNIL